MKKTTFNISKMDCSAEEQLVRMKLEGNQNIKSLQFDLPKRKLEVIHSGEPKEIENALTTLNLNSKLIDSESVDENIYIAQDTTETKLLWVVLIINFLLFVLEIVAGFIADSMGLVADSLDMLADAFVYGLALFAVGKAIQRKKNIAKITGYIQMTLAVFGFIEVIRRFIGVDETPDFKLMILISAIALAGNAACLFILKKNKSKDAHMEASVIFTSTDVLVNIGVIAAGAAVYLTHSKYPDLIVGMIVFALVMRGALRILKLSK